MIPLLRLTPFVGILLLAWTPAPAAERVETIPTRAGITVKAIVNADAGPGAPIVILLVGGNGTLGLDTWSGAGDPSENFLVRARGLFAGEGLNTVVPDAPSDVTASRGGGLRGFRTSDAYAADMAAIVAYLRGKGLTEPAFLIGTSRGTIGAAGAAAKLPEGAIAGIVLTASVTRTNRQRPQDSLRNVKLALIRVPVLFAHHEDDACYVAVASDVPHLAREMTGAPVVKILTYTGGGPYVGDDCEARSAHGFPGIEAKVVGDIAAWIKAVVAGKPAP